MRTAAMVMPCRAALQPLPNKAANHDCEFVAKAELMKKAWRSLMSRPKRRPDARVGQRRG